MKEVMGEEGNKETRQTESMSHPKEGRFRDKTVFFLKRNP